MLENAVSNIIEENNLSSCWECGKCTGSCPIARFEENFSPRNIVENMIINKEDFLKVPHIWECLACNLCVTRCPSKVKFSESIRSLRAVVNRYKLVDTSDYYRELMVLKNITTDSWINRRRFNWIPKSAKTSKKGEIAYFVGCLPYFDGLFEIFNVKSTEISSSSLKSLNKGGISPVILHDEQCCGHDALWIGDQKTFEKYANANMEMFRKARVKKIYTSCPECLRTLKIDYPEYLGSRFDFEVYHISEFLSEYLDKGRIKFNGIFDKRVTYHDPCRLGHHLGIYDEPRKVIAAIPGIDFVEMERNRSNSYCCGVSSWIKCDTCNNELSTAKIKDAVKSGADILITTCPKCQIHLTCHSKQSKFWPEKPGIEISDLTVITSKSLGG